ncbi:MAG: hypothetical protein NWQ76_02090 [Candidatus Nanopelagicaceae bacterium]|nr:hypothetical protein [Candidatus Nanopelagicaceae bacterium]
MQTPLASHPYLNRTALHASSGTWNFSQVPLELLLFAHLFQGEL